MQRGDIWWVDLPEPIGSMPGYRRPALIVSADSYNFSALNTILVVVITSNLRLRDAPGNIFLPKNKSGLSKDSVANVTQLVAVDRSLFSEKVATLPFQIMQQVENGLRIVLDL